MVPTRLRVSITEDDRGKGEVGWRGRNEEGLTENYCHISEK